MKKKLLSLALCLCMVLSLLPGVALANSNLYITVNGVNIVSDGNPTGESMPAGVSYAKGVLTLENANIEINQTSDPVGISSNLDLTINLVGTNNISGAGDFGIKVAEGKLTFTGDGKLDIAVENENSIGIGSSDNSGGNGLTSIDTQKGTTVTVSQAAYGVRNQSNPNSILTLYGSGHLTAKGSINGISAHTIRIDGAHVTAVGTVESATAFSVAPVFWWGNEDEPTIPQTYFNMGVKTGDSEQNAATVAKAWEKNNIIDYTTSKYVDIDLYNLVFGTLKTLAESGTVTVSGDNTSSNEPAIAWLGDSLTLNVEGQNTITSTFSGRNYTFKSFMAAIYAPNSAVSVTGGGTLTATSDLYDVVTKENGFTDYDKLNGIVFFAEGDAHKGTVSGKCDYRESLISIGAPSTNDPYNVLTVPEKATLVVPEAKTMVIQAVEEDGVKAVDNSGTLENNGKIELPKYECYYGSEETKIDKLSTYLGKLIGTGYITLNGNNYTNSGVKFDELIPEAGLDLRTAPTSRKVYKAGSGFATWEPTLTDGAVTGGTLTLDGASISSTGTALTLPTETSVTITLTGSSSLTGSIYALTGGSEIIISGSGSLTAIGGTNAFSAAPSFGSGYTPIVTAGDSAENAVAVSAPTDDTYSSNKYVKIEKYVAPSSGGGGGGAAIAPSAPTVEAPKTDSGTTTVTVEVKPNVSGGAAKAEIPNATVDKAVETAVEAAKTGQTTAAVEIKVKAGNTAASKVETTLPAASITKIAETKTALAITTEVAAVALPAEAVAAIAEQAGGKGVALTIEAARPEDLTPAQQSALGVRAKSAVIVNLSLTAGDKKISDLGGSAAVSVPVTLSEGQKPEHMKAWYVADDGSISPCKGSFEDKAGKYGFECNHFSTYVLVEFPLEDVSEDAWYYGSVAYAYMNKLFSGTSETTFEPETTISRAMLVTVLWRMEGEPVVNYLMPFSDVDEGQWHSEAIRWAASEKLVNGVSATEFAPNAMVTREQLSAILYNYAVAKKLDVSVGENTNILSYTDALSISEYAIPAMQWATGAKLVNGADGMLMPQGSATRAQVAAILHRFCNAFVK